MGASHIDIDLEDPDVEKAATKKQAESKHLNVLDPEVKEIETKTDNSTTINEENQGIKIENLRTEDEVIDIDLNDPDVESAATKIQAGFKGMEARKEVSELKNKNKDEPSSDRHNEFKVTIHKAEK